MMKLWNATLQRKQRDRTHLVVVDEAALFQTNPMPRMLAESRKFGLAKVSAPWKSDDREEMEEETY